jgi:hypothetical protein
VLTEYSDGQMVWLKPASSNTGASTINVSSLGVKNIRALSRTVLVGGEMLAGYWHLLKYSSTLDEFILVSDPGKTEVDLGKTLIGGTGIEVNSSGTDEIYVAIENEGVDTTEIADDAVTTDKIADGAVTADKMAVGVGVTPTGTIIMAATADVPTGFLECDGASLSRETYAGLFAVIGTTYGAADGSTFKVPDYRGRFLRGWAHGVAIDPDKATRTDRGDGTGGDVVGSKQTDQFKGHSHTRPSHRYPRTDDVFDHSFYRALGNSYNASNNVSGGNETRPTNINVMYCIKY